MQARHNRRQGALARRSPARNSNLSRILRRFYVAIIALLTLLALGTWGFWALGPAHTRISTALYMTLITITTVGYEEAVPLRTTAAQLFAGGLSLLGFGILTFLFTSLTIFFFESDIDERLRRTRMDREIARLRGHYIICGYGRVGRNVGHELFATERPFVAIDEQGEQLQYELDRHPHLLYLQGDASDDDTLLMANIEQAHGVFAVTGDDSRNLMIALSAKQLRPEIRVVARCHDVRNIGKMQKAGADAIVSPDFTGGMRIASAMIRPQVVTFLDEMLRSDEGLRVEEVRLPQDCHLNSLQHLPLRGRNYIIVALRRREGTLFNPEEQTVLEADDVLIVMINPQGRHELAQHLEARQDSGMFA